MKKITRSEKDRKIAGVCAGVAEYFNIDPVIVRILFFVSIACGGIGVLVYIIMWIVIPLMDPNAGEISSAKRLHLSSSDKKIAGVCGGLGEFFNFDPTILRVVFVVFAIAGGFGILIYLIFWIATPKKADQIIV